MLGARQERGGPKLYKNLLVLHTLKRAREEQKKIEAAEAVICISEKMIEILDEDEEMIQPPLEFSVTDDEDGISVLDADAPLVFATEATESCEMEDEPMKKVSPPAPLSSALNDALAKIGSSIDRKRKPSKTVAQPQKKATRVTISCK